MLTGVLVGLALVLIYAKQIKERISLPAEVKRSGPVLFRSVCHCGGL